MAEIKKYMDLTALGTLVDQIKAEDAEVLQSAKDYSDSLATNYDGAGAATSALAEAKAYTDTLANGAVATNTAAISTLNGDTTTEGSVAKAVADAQATLQASIDETDAVANKNAEDIVAINDETNGILAQAKAYADEQDTKVQANVDAVAEDLAELDTYVGDIPSDYTETNIVAYINKKAQETLDSASGGSSESAASVLAALNTYKAENDPKVAANTTAAEKAQTTADEAQAYAEGVAANLETETTNRENADSALDERIQTLEGQITGLSGAMHFEGVKDEVPTDVSGYENGDVIIVGDKEYVFNGAAFVEFGDVSAQAEAITSLTGRMDTAEGKITTAEGKITDLEGVVAAKAEQTALDEAVETLEGEDTAIKSRLDTIEAAIGESGSVADDISTAKQEAIDTAAADATTKANQALTDAKAYTDTEVGKDRTRLDALEADTHTHSNKDLLDTYTQTEENLADAVAKKHEHSNLTVLEGITEAKVTAWDAAESNAKTYADGLNTTMQGVVDGIGERVGTLETTIVDKAEADDLEAAVERIAKNETDIVALTSSVNSFTAITSSEVNALFA